MVDLHVLSGKKAGSRAAAGRFPFRIGRAPQNDLLLEDDGVWDQHLVLEFREKDGFYLSAASNAIATVNGKPLQEALLRNGDVITAGSAKIQFWLAPVPQRGLRLQENMVWALLIVVTLVQFFLICAFLR
jgi:pSer/pThr/pTyr-binding forkhead associated (FHA) protein